MKNQFFRISFFWSMSIFIITTYAPIANSTSEISPELLSSGEWFIWNPGSSCIKSADTNNSKSNPTPSKLLKLEAGCKIGGYEDTKKMLVVDCTKTKLKTTITYSRTMKDCEQFVKFIMKDQMIEKVDKKFATGGKVQWLINPNGSCMKAEGEISLARIGSENPECFIDQNADLIKGLTLLNCTSSKLKVNLMFADSKLICMKAIKQAKALGAM